MESLASGLSGQRYAQTLAGALALKLKTPHLSAAVGLRCRTSLLSRINRFNRDERNENMLRYRLLLVLALGILVLGMMVSIGCQAESPVGDEAVAGGLIEGDRPYLVQENSDQVVEEIAEDLKEPNLTFWAKPQYPDQCRKQGVAGSVHVKILVNNQGAVVEAEVMDGPECLRESALAAAKKCRFVPATSSGKPVSAWVVIPYEFKLQ